ncbi:MAG: hypothetical protein HOP28_14450 [Gemmatimonadales bacterium]|nr:hypothetical protein [Gemmatimonadales bacterium]
MSILPKLSASAALAVLAACSGSGAGNYGCGIAAVAGQSLILEEFTRAGKTLSGPPTGLAGRLPVRIALGPGFRGVAGRSDSTVVIGLEGTLPDTPPVGFGVLIVDAADSAVGVLLYNGDPIRGAPVIGTLSAGERSLPLIGLRTDVKNFQDASCPIFPDSLRR